MKLHQTPIHRLHQMRLAGEVSTVEIAQAVLNRLADTEPQLGAFLQQTEPQAVLAAAQAADQNLQKKQTLGMFAGMPISIKDIFNQIGTNTTCGSRYLEHYQSPYDATVVTRLKEAGCNLVGKTNMDEFAMGISTETSALKLTKNPWNLAHVPGGSSGGSAASVAAGQALASIGTDTGGSIRQPAGYCGIVGIKPSYGRVSRWGMVAYASSLDQAGPMTRDVEDAAHLLQAIWGHDPKDATSLRAPLPDLAQALHKDIKGMKVGIIKDLDLNSCSPEVQSTFQANLKTLTVLGAELVEVSLPNLKHAIATYYIIAPSEASSNLGRYDGIRYGLRSSEAANLSEVYQKSREAGLGSEVKLRILIGTFALSAGYYDAYYIKAQKVQNLIRAQYANAFSQVDVIATPVAPTPAFKFGEASADPLQMYLADAFTCPVNLAGLPGISVPGGFTAQGLPLGLQLIGGYLQEQKLIQAAHALETALALTPPPLAL